MIIKILIIFIIFFVILFLPKQLSRLSNRLGKSIGKLIDKKIEDLPKSSRRIGEGLGEKIQFTDDLLKTVGEGGNPLAKIEELAGRRMLKEKLSKTPAIEKTKEAETVEKIGRRLAAYARRSHIPFRFFLVDSPGIENAYAIPGGSILITRVLLDIYSSEDELAGVLAHEIAHIDCHHSSKALAVSLGTSPLVIPDNAILRQAGKLFDKLIESGYSQDNEFEADREGALLAKRAGFDPFGNMDLMKMEEGVYATEEHSYFSTHPPRHERIRELRKLLSLG